MKIVSWNCCRGFDNRKPETIFAAFPDADIFVIQECREIDMDKAGFDKVRCDWYGDHKEAETLPGNIRAERDLGIGIFWKDGITVEQDANFDKGNRYVVPYNITWAGKPFGLYAVWTKSGYADYHVPVNNSLKKLSSTEKPIIFIGDFNTGSMRGSQNAHWYEKLKNNFLEKDFYNCAGNKV